MLNIIDILT